MGEYKDLFEPEDRPKSAPPVFNKARTGDKESSPSARSKFAPVKLIAIGAMLCFFLIPSNAANCLAFIGGVCSQCANYNAAVHAYNLAHTLQPNSPEIMYSRACALSKLNDLEGASSDFSFVIAHDPQNEGAYFGRGVARSDLRDYKNAITDFDRFIALQPKSADGYVRRGIANAKLGHYDQAIKDYDQATKLDPSDAEAMYNRSWAQELQYDEAMENDESAPTLAMVQGSSHGAGLVSGQTKPAIQEKKQPGAGQQAGDRKLAELNTLIQISPSAEHYCDRGWRLLSINSLKQAVADFDAAIRLNANFSRAYLDRGLAYYRLNQLKKAIQDYSQSIAIDGQNASAYYRRAVAFDKQGQYTLSANDYQQAGRLNPGRAKTYAALASADLNRMRKDVHLVEQKSKNTVTASAVKQPIVSLAAAQPHGTATVPVPPYRETRMSERQPITKAVATSSGDGSYLGHWELAKELYQEKHYQRALPEYLATLASNPPREVKIRLYRELGMCYFFRGEAERGAAYINASFNMNPDDPYTLSARGLLWLHRHEFEKALADANRALSLDPNCGFAYSDRMKAYQAMGKDDLAAQDQERLRELKQQHTRQFAAQ